MSLVFYLIWHWKFLKQFVCFVCDCSTYFASAVSIYCCLIVKRISFKTACTICSLENHKLCYLHFKKLPSYGPFHLISTPPVDEIFRGGLESYFWRAGRVGILWSLEVFLGVWEKWAISEGWDSVSTFDFFLRVKSQTTPSIGGRGVAIMEWPSPILSPEWKHVQSVLAFSNGDQSLLVHCGQ